MLSIESMLLLTPLLLFLVDIVAKIGFRVPIDSVGADLCMYSISFHFTSLLFDKLVRAAYKSNTQVAAQQFDLWQTSTGFTLVVSLLLWFLSLMLISEAPRFRVIDLLRSKNRLDVVIAVCLGMVSLYIGIYVFFSVDGMR